MNSKRSKSHNFIIMMVITACMLGISGVLVSQDISGNNTANQKKEKPARYLAEKEYWPMTQDDPRFSITGLTYDRRFAKNGSGEFLDVVFNLDNLTSKDLNLTAFVMAFWESNAVDKKSRTYIPYPSWRKRDYDKEKNMVHYIRFAPNFIPAAAVWDYKDSDFFKQSSITAHMRHSIIGNSRPVVDTLPPFWKYIEYARYNAEKGLMFRVYGEVGPTDDKKLETNYIDATEEENKTKVFKKVDVHTYTLEHSRRRTIFRTFHYSKFRATYKYFNRLAIILMDSDKVKIWNDQKERELKPGEERVDPIVMQHVHRIKTSQRNN